jgi:iron complex outermembrane receptor protein/hemoglobin/transferrin/lactoferrin receptor protein
VLNPADGQVPPVPRFLPDGRTQRGTGFDEWTADVRLVFRPRPEESFTVASYLYRQLNAPRTDQCPPPYARDDECLVYAEQFRTLTYAAWELHPGEGALRWARVTASWQAQHELRNGNRPASFVVNTGEDDVDTFGLTAATRFAWSLGEPTLALTTGLDGYLDLVRSESAIRFTDIDVTVPRSRGQYLDGSRYFTGGVFADLALAPSAGWVLRGGARVGWVEARAPGDPESGTRPVNGRWVPVAGHLGAEWQLHPIWTLLADLTSRSGRPTWTTSPRGSRPAPGSSSRTRTFAPSARSAPSWAPGSAPAPCAPSSGCSRPGSTRRSGRSPFRRASVLPDAAVPRLLEPRPAGERQWRVGPPWPRGPGPGAARARLVSRATVAWTWGEGPNLADRPVDPTVPYAERVPLSRVPPLNGTVETEWSLPLGFRLGAALRWAGAQTRLAVADQSDARIPLGGTPGYAVVDLRAGWAFGGVGSVALVLENLLDTPYRVHGSSVNGAARGLIASLTLHPF